MYDQSSLAPLSTICVQQTNQLYHLSCVTDLEHTELLPDVRETLGLLRLVANHVESHSLGQRSRVKSNSKRSPALTNGHNISFLHIKAGRAVSRNVTMSLFVTITSAPSSFSYRLYFLT